MNEVFIHSFMYQRGHRKKQRLLKHINIIYHDKDAISPPVFYYFCTIFLLWSFWVMLKLEFKQPLIPLLLILTPRVKEEGRKDDER